MKHCASGQCAFCVRRREQSRAESLAAYRLANPRPPFDPWETKIGPDDTPPQEYPRQRVQDPGPQNKIIYMRERRPSNRRKKIHFEAKPC